MKGDAKRTGTQAELLRQALTVDLFDRVTAHQRGIAWRKPRKRLLDV